jgi:hypothetical protein
MTKISKNALTHGCYASEVVMPWENSNEFDDMLTSYLDEFCSEGESEKAVVFELASLQWKKRRLEAGLKEALQKLRDFDANQDQDLVDLAKAHYKAARVGTSLYLDYLQQFYAANVATANPQPANASTQPSAPAANNQPGSAKANPQSGAATANVQTGAAKASGQALDFDNLMCLLKEMNIFGAGLVVPALQADEKRRLNAIEDAYQPQLLEKELKIQAEIDRRIEKTLKRLVMIKEIKRQYAAKAVNASQIEATKSSDCLTHPTVPETKRATG